MDINPFPEAAPDFSDPIGLLQACHQRIIGHCKTLQKLILHLREKGLDSEARQAIGRIHRYFSSAAQHHHQDEEQDLFPILSRQSLKLADAVHRLRSDHQEMDAKWQALKPLLEKPSAIVEDLDGFAALVAEFDTVYREHIAREDGELFEMARHILSQEQTRQLGNAMAIRRGQRPSYI